MTAMLTVAERACVLRAVRKERDFMREERNRLILLDHHIPIERRRRIDELEEEINCLSRAINALWRLA